MELAAAIAICALCAWDIGRRHLSGVRKAERDRAERLAAEVADIKTEQQKHAETLARYDRQLTDLRGTRVEPRRPPHLSGVGR